MLLLTRSNSVIILKHISVSKSALHKNPKFILFFEHTPNVLECDCVTGNYSVLLKVAFPSTMELDEFIGKLGFLPMEERKRIGVSFANVFKRTANDRNTVASFLSDPKYPIVQGKDGSLQYDWQEVEKGAEQRATRHFTDEDVEYFGMLRKVVESLEDLEAWETEHAYSHFKDWRDPFAGLRNPSIHGAPVVINHGGHIDILMNPDFKNWFQRQIGKTLGKMNPEALRMIREMADED